jgi:hypothetical protein
MVEFERNSMLFITFTLPQLALALMAIFAFGFIIIELLNYPKDKE